MTGPSSAPRRPPRGRTIDIIDLFAGVGGLSEGFRRTNDEAADPQFRTVSAVEMDPRAAAGYALNHARAGTHHGPSDATAPDSPSVFAGPIQEWLVTHEVPQADLIIGGPPCQGFSALGKRRLNDERNLLWKPYAEVVQKASPKYFVLENVPQFHTSPQYEVFKAMTRPGEILDNYAITPHLLNAADYGTPQTRQRIIVIGRHKDMPDPGTPRPSHAQQPTLGDDLEPWITVRDILTGLGPVQTLPAGRITDVEGRAVPGAFRLDELHVGRRYSDKSRERFKKIPAGGNRFSLPDELKCPAWLRHTSGSGDVMGRLHWDRPSVTIRTEFIKPEKGRYLHPDPSELRAITPMEGGLLQGFPRHYQFIGSMTDIVKQIGNAVPIQLGAAIARHLRPFLV